MALIEKTRKVTEVYLVNVCDGCGSEDVTTNVDDQVFCDACLRKVEAAPADSTPAV